jgi:hypothetical protein
MGCEEVLAIIEFLEKQSRTPYLHFFSTLLGSRKKSNKKKEQQDVSKYVEFNT